MSNEEIAAEITTKEPEKFFTKPLLVIFITMFIDLIGFGIALPVLPDYAKNEFGASPFTIGWLLAFRVIFAANSQFPNGALDPSRYPLFGLTVALLVIVILG